MKKALSNLDYFKISQDNPEPALDDFYIFDERHPQINNYIDNTRQIKKILITIETLIKKKEKEAIVNKYFQELSNTLNKYSNCSEFSCFINACDNTLDYVKNDIFVLKKITKKYFSKRVLSELVPEEWIQAVLDSSAGRKKGVCGENKLISILERKAFKKVDSWQDFNRERRCLARFSKIFDLTQVRENLDIKIKTKKQNKKLDLLIKNKEQIYLLEAKHLNTGGGGQDKQISELIELLNLKEKNKNIHYISFLDGNYSNILLSNSRGGSKITQQRKEIINYLKHNPQNYWLNTQGYVKLFE